jgi:hypothetical protein
MKPSTRIVTVLLLAIATISMATGCEAIIGQAVKSGVESATGVKVDESGNSVTMTGQDGSSVSVGEDGKLPEGFPTDVPVYEGAVKAAIATDSDKGKGFMVNIETPDAPADVFKWYEDEMASGGWTVKSTMKTGDGGLLSGEKDALGLTVTVTPAGTSANTNISLAVAPK